MGSEDSDKSGVLNTFRIHDDKIHDRDSRTRKKKAAHQERKKNYCSVRLIDIIFLIPKLLFSITFIIHFTTKN